MHMCVCESTCIWVYTEYPAKDLLILKLDISKTKDNRRRMRQTVYLLRKL